MPANFRVARHSSAKLTKTDTRVIEESPKELERKQGAADGKSMS